LRDAASDLDRKDQTVDDVIAEAIGAARRLDRVVAGMVHRLQEGQGT